MVLTMPSIQLMERFGFSPVQKGLCYLPIFVGSNLQPLDGGVAAGLELPPAHHAARHRDL